MPRCWRIFLERRIVILARIIPPNSSVAVRILKEQLADHLVNGVQYETINEWYEMTQLEASIESWMDYLAPAVHSVYNLVICESQVEKEFDKALKNSET